MTKVALGKEQEIMRLLNDVGKNCCLHPHYISIRYYQILNSFFKHASRFMWWIYHVLYVLHLNLSIADQGNTEQPWILLLN